MDYRFNEKNSIIFEENVREHLYNLMVGKNSLNKIQIQTIRERLRNVTTLKLGVSNFQNIPLIKLKYNLQTGRRYLSMQS